MKICCRYLKGGILSKGITEISGESGSGKSQMCLQLSLNVQLPLEEGGLNGGACYISTEGAFPTKRLKQMLIGLRKKHPNLIQNEKMMELFTDRIFVESVPTLEALCQLLDERLPFLLQQQQVKLIIIDSIAALFRFEFGSEELLVRSQIIWKLANQLKLLSDSFNIPIVIVNQVCHCNPTVHKKLTLIKVSDVFQDNKGNNFAMDSLNKVVPALGLSWSNCVNTRIMLSRTEKMVPIAISEFSRKRKLDEDTRKLIPKEVIVRKLQVLFAPHLPNITCDFIVDPDGVIGIE
jgi:DNA-repair protein XRCC3